ncbi:STM4015 family protein [Yinghuangia soli]|uniref:STM4015 family protein n=1 Tax=Yinghuangia soli TaxID=2908204 RepID=A0AA41PTP3_9ACTN|nr:STM4015 family protein [Yinghuangia soli]MCF2525685.1 STM4015 family protein [Yinghuangia soli]
MTVEDHATEFAGLPVVEAAVTADGTVSIPQVADPSAVAWRLRLEDFWDYTGIDGTEKAYADLFATLLDTVGAGDITALIMGCWGYVSEQEATGPRGPIGLVHGARDRLTNLRALFLGDIVREESDIAYIQQGDLGDLIEAYPGLEELTVRGAEGLVFPARTHPNLRSLRLQSGGMPSEVVRAVAAGSFPELRELEIWFGLAAYGGTARIADLAPILAGTALPKLSRLGLMDSPAQDEIASAVASAPVVAQLRELDLSMGTLGDEGAEALLAGQPLTHLARLTLRHHFVGKPLQYRLRETLEPAGVHVDLSDAFWRPGLQGRFVEVSE